MSSLHKSLAFAFLGTAFGGSLLIGCIGLVVHSIMTRNVVGAVGFGITTLNVLYGLVMFVRLFWR